VTAQLLDLGQTFRATATVTQPDANGNPQLVNAGTCICTITLPDATTATPAVVNDSTGLYHADYVTTQAGRHSVAWVTTVPGTATTDVFNVRTYLPMIGLAEAKAHLNGVSPTGSDDDELRNFIAAATEVVESKVGPCARRTVTQRITEGRAQLVLNTRPVISVASVTSVWPGGPVWLTSQLIVDTWAGIVQQAFPWPFWWGPWDVAYTAGRAIIPEKYLHAAKEQLRHLWETQRGSTPLLAPLGAGGAEEFVSSSGWAFSIPNRVVELLSDEATPAI
jgi:hypothetical protein